MAGHNKWSKIKHKKAKEDAHKGKAFTKVVREIVVAARAGGGDPDMNPALRLAIQKAKAVNMPNDNVKRAIEKGAGGGDGADLEQITYEAYGPNGVALLIETLTDNRNRTLPNLKMIVNKLGGNMAEQGSVAYMFDKKGVVYFEPGANEEQIIELALEAGADDVRRDEDGSVVVETAPEHFEPVVTAISDAGIEYADANLDMVAQTTVPLDKELAEKIMKLVDAIEEDDDVQNVYGNYEIDDAIAEEIMGS